MSDPRPPSLPHSNHSTESATWGATPPLLCGGLGGLAPLLHTSFHVMKLSALGDQAVLAYLPDEAAAVGFVPGFPYLGYLPAELCGVGRLPSPRVRVEAGSVGLTGRQTGVYPLPRPGGWNLIGRTPLVVVDVAAGFFPLRVGDAVRFA